MRTIPFVDLKLQYEALRSEIAAAVEGVLDSTAFILGPEVDAFEAEFAEYCGSDYCIGVASGTAALKIAMQVLGIGAGDEVILPANTYIASALAVSQLSATPVLVDIDAQYHIDVARIEAAITAKTKAIMVVHLYGNAVPMEPITQVAKTYGLRIIEDACQAHGAFSSGRRAGSIGDVGAFSFYPGKNLGAYGDGGAVITNDPELADGIRLMRDFGQRKKNIHLLKGDNSRLDALQAAILRVKLRHLDVWNEKRRACAETYDRALLQLGVQPPPRSSGAEHVFHLYVIELAERDKARALLERRGIATGVHYPIPIHLQPAYRDLALAAGAFPRTEAAAKCVLSLPMYPELSQVQLTQVVGAVEEHLRGVVYGAA